MVLVLDCAMYNFIKLKFLNDTLHSLFFFYLSLIQVRLVALYGLSLVELKVFYRRILRLVLFLYLVVILYQCLLRAVLGLAIT